MARRLLMEYVEVITVSSLDGNERKKKWHEK